MWSFSNNDSAETFVDYVCVEANYVVCEVLCAFIDKTDTTQVEDEICCGILD